MFSFPGLPDGRFLILELSETSHARSTSPLKFREQIIAPVWGSGHPPKKPAGGSVTAELARADWLRRWSPSQRPTTYEE
jgi:hypothetical protein